MSVDFNFEPQRAQSAQLLLSLFGAEGVFDNLEAYAVFDYDDKPGRKPTVEEWVKMRSPSFLCDDDEDDEDDDVHAMELTEQTRDKTAEELNAEADAAFAAVDHSPYMLPAYFMDHALEYRGVKFTLYREFSYNGEDRHETYTINFGDLDHDAACEILADWSKLAYDRVRMPMIPRPARVPELCRYKVPYGWRDSQLLVPRPASSVPTPDNVVAQLCEDIQRFRSRRKWYQKRGVPWRRGYLLYGVPGTGKTSIIRSLATELNLGLAAISIAQAGLSDDELTQALQYPPRQSIIVLEDVDAAFAARKRGSDAASNVTFSGLLNALDGLGAQEGNVMIMTSNHPEKLDPALLRPGRADRHFEVKPLTGVEGAQLFRNFFPEAEEKFADAIELVGGSKPGAVLQGCLLEHMESPEEAAEAMIKSLGGTVEKPRASKPQGKPGAPVVLAA